MNTNEAVVSKVKNWLTSEHKSYQWMADQLNVSKALIGHLLSGERTLQPKHIEQFANVLGLSVQELVKTEQQGPLTVQLRGNLSNRRSKRELDALLFAIEDYIGLKEQVDK